MQTHSRQSQPLLLPSSICRESLVANDSASTRNSLSLITLAIVFAVAVHGVVLFLPAPTVPQSSSKQILTLQLQYAAVATQRQQAPPAKAEAMPPTPKKPQQTPSPGPVEQAPAAPNKSKTGVPEPAAEGALQRYLQRGELPESVQPVPEVAPADDNSAIFSPKLRRQLAQAKARRQSLKGSQQRYTWNSGEQYQQQDGKCFIGRHMVHEGGRMQVWYPTKCREKDAAAAALRQLRLP